MAKEQEGAPEFRGITRLVDKDVDGNIKIKHALSLAKGISFMMANAICAVLKIDIEKKVGFLTPAELAEIEDCAKNPLKHGIPVWLLNRRKDAETGKDEHLVSSDLLLKQKFDIRNMQRIKCYKGLRHARGLRVRGQRTRSTGRKGRTLGVQRKKEVKSHKAASDK